MRKGILRSPLNSHWELKHIGYPSGLNRTVESPSEIYLLLPIYKSVFNFVTVLVVVLYKESWLYSYTSWSILHHVELCGMMQFNYKKPPLV